MELYLTEDVKENKMGFKYINNRRKTKDNVDLLLNGEGTLVIEDTDKTELLNTAFGLMFVVKTSPQVSLTQEIRVKECWRKEYFPLVEEDCARGHLGKLKVHTYMAPDAVHR